MLGDRKLNFTSHMTTKIIYVVCPYLDFTDIPSQDNAKWMFQPGNEM